MECWKFLWQQHGKDAYVSCEKLFRILLIISEPTAIKSAYKNIFCLRTVIVITSYTESAIYLPSPQHAHLTSILLINFLEAEPADLTPLIPKFTTVKKS